MKPLTALYFATGFLSAGIVSSVYVDFWFNERCKKSKKIENYYLYWRHYITAYVMGITMIFTYTIVKSIEQKK